jgi:EAL domain-containing protein (putative c-di-GMP-specific phosphodiesterase class I)
VRVAGEDVRGQAEGPDIATGLTDGSLEVRYDAALDAGGSPALLAAVPSWRHGVLGPVPPQELWATAERQGRTVDLARWLLRTACAEVAALDDLLPVAVALPPGHWSPEGLADDVRAALAGAQLPAGRLVLALTEEALVASTAALLPELHAVQQAGVRLMIDGYGMGHTLFALLARVPLAAVRVDLAALVVHADPGRAERALTAIARTAGEFGLLTVAEGIDTPTALAAAREAGAALVQGRLLPSELAPADVRRLLAGLAPAAP